MAKILDACCGSKMFWFDKQHEDVLYMDNRQLSTTLCDGRTLNVNPDVIADFRNMPFDDESFYLVVFDPPHLIKAGDDSWLAKKYGKLNIDTWQQDIASGFNECMRVLKPNGTLIFKWNEDQIKLREILNVIDYKPLFGNRRSKTHWLVFMKDEYCEVKEEKGMQRSVIFDVTSKTVESVAEQISKKHEDRLMVIAPLAGSISVHAPSKKGKNKGYHRFKFEVWIPEEAIEGESALSDFGACVLMTLPKNRVKEHLKNED